MEGREFREDFLRNLLEKERKREISRRPKKFREVSRKYEAGTPLPSKGNKGLVEEKVLKGVRRK